MHIFLFLLTASIIGLHSADLSLNEYHPRIERRDQFLLRSVLHHPQTNIPTFYVTAFTGDALTARISAVLEYVHHCLAQEAGINVFKMQLGRVNVTEQGQPYLCYGIFQHAVSQLPHDVDLADYTILLKLPALFKKHPGLRAIFAYATIFKHPNLQQTALTRTMGNDGNEQWQVKNFAQCFRHYHNPLVHSLICALVQYFPDGSYKTLETTDVSGPYGVLSARSELVEIAAMLQEPVNTMTSLLSSDRLLSLCQDAVRLTDCPGLSEEGDGEKIFKAMQAQVQTERKRACLIAELFQRVAHDSKHPNYALVNQIYQFCQIHGSQTHRITCYKNPDTDQWSVAKEFQESSASDAKNSTQTIAKCFLQVIVGAQLCTNAGLPTIACMALPRGQEFPHIKRADHFGIIMPRLDNQPHEVELAYPESLEEELETINKYTLASHVAFDLATGFFDGRNANYIMHRGVLYRTDFEWIFGTIKNRFQTLFICGLLEFYGTAADEEFFFKKRRFQVKGKKNLPRNRETIRALAQALHDPFKDHIAAMKAFDLPNALRLAIIDAAENPCAGFWPKVTAEIIDDLQKTIEDAEHMLLLMDRAIKAPPAKDKDYVL